MNSRKENETFYQNNGVELGDEALAKVVGGCGDSNNCNHDGGWDNGNGWDNGDGNNGWGNGNGGYGRGQRCHHREPGLLGDLLGDLL